MKLIIDISEDTKNRLCFGITYQKDIQTICEALNNGTPLDKIGAEIEQMNENALNLLMPFDSIDNVNYTRGFIDGLGSALDCIDKYRNEVSK